MPDLLIELFSEEIPARMQARAAEDLRKLVTDGLVEAGLVYEGAKAFATPRRLALNVAGVPARSPDVREERKGPRVGSPEKAIEGFLRGAGLSSIDEAKIESDPKKGEFYVAVIEKPGRTAEEVIAELMPDVIRRFPWPKSMRWGSGTLRWVRPLHSIVCVFGPETEETDVVSFEVDGIKSGRTTRGHRFMAPAAFEVRRFDDYVKKLHDAKVVLDPARRKEMIRTDARNLAFAQGLDLIEDEGLLDEVAGLVEWPVVLMGQFDEAFLEIPPEVIRLTIRANQKCFVVSDPGTGVLANRFVLVANLEAEDGGRKIVEGNQRVIAARLSDARFFWEQDKATKLADHARKLAHIVFHEKLGTQGDRVERIARLAREIAPAVGADPEKAEHAARLAKADLVTEMVGEFPELQGAMGRYYALAEGRESDLADACRDHYKPVGQGDEVPTAPVSVAVSLADKIDMLSGFWAIGEKPTGSRDPFALRRAALGAIQLTISNQLRLNLDRWLKKALRLLLAQRPPNIPNLAGELWDSGSEASEWISYACFGGPWAWAIPPACRNQLLELVPLTEENERAAYKILDVIGPPLRLIQRYAEEAALLRNLPDPDGHALASAVQDSVYDLARDLDDLSAHWRADLLAFFADRLKVQLRDQGARHDLVDAVFALPGQDDLLMIVRRVEALGSFLDTEDGSNLLSAYRRAANILRIEEKKDGRSHEGEADRSALVEKAEIALHERLAAVTAEADTALAAEDFAAAMAALSQLRAPVDAFFDHVTVNAGDPALRENRLKLLSQIRSTMDRVADFSKIGG